MREPTFWTRTPGAEAALLMPLATLYGAVATTRLRRPGRAAGIPVLCVGNLTLGGAGKTPTAIAIGRLLQAAGAHPFFLSRGYGGRLAGPVLVDRVQHAPSDVGDEPLLLSRIAPTIVARDRVAGATAAREAGANCIVMDDGFQNPSLAKDFSILVVDGRRGIGNAMVFPAGPLRAPLAVQVVRANAVVVIGEAAGAAAVVAVAKAWSIPVFQASLVPEPDDVAALAGRPVLAFAGIGDPGKFFATLTDAGIDIRAQQSFPDHHSYTEKDAATLLGHARANDLVLVTTEKDMVRLAEHPQTAELAAATRTLSVSVAFENAPRFTWMVERAMNTGLSWPQCSTSAAK